MGRHTISGILFDMDGVLYNSEKPIPGAAETLQWVCRQQIPHLFVTNTTSRGRSALVQKLARFGIEATADQILTPCVATTSWLQSQKPGKLALFLRPAARDDFGACPCVPEDAEDGAALCSHRRSRRGLGLPGLEPGVSTPAPQLRYPTDRFGHDSLLAESQWPLIGCGAFCSGAGACHRAPRDCARETGSGFLSHRCRTTGFARRVGNDDRR